MDYAWMITAFEWAIWRKLLGVDPEVMEGKIQQNQVMAELLYSSKMFPEEWVQ